MSSGSIWALICYQLTVFLIFSITYPEEGAIATEDSDTRMFFAVRKQVR